MILAPVITVSLLAVGPIAVTHFDSDRPVRMEGSVLRVGESGAVIRARVVCPPVVRLEWLGEVGATYLVEESSDFNTWKSGNIQIVGQGIPVQWFVSPDDQQQQFYRVRIL